VGQKGKRGSERRKIQRRKNVLKDRRRGIGRELNKTTSREIKVRKIGLKMTGINK